MRFKVLFIACLFLFNCVSSYAVSDTLMEESVIHGLSNAIAQGAKTFDKKVIALMQFVHDKIKPRSNRDPNEQLTTLQRIQQEVGWCNHQASVFMHLAYYQDIRTRMLYLLNKDGSVSPHTIAEVWVENDPKTDSDDEWIVVDPHFILYGFRREDIDLEKVAVSPMVVKWREGNGYDKEQTIEWFSCFLNEPEIAFELNP